MTTELTFGRGPIISDGFARRAGRQVLPILRRVGDRILYKTTLMVRRDPDAMRRRAELTQPLLRVFSQLWHRLQIVRPGTTAPSEREHSQNIATPSPSSHLLPPLRALQPPASDWSLALVSRRHYTESDVPLPLFPPEFVQPRQTSVFRNISTTTSIKRSVAFR